MSMLFTLLLRNTLGPEPGCPHLPDCRVVTCLECEEEYCEVHDEHEHEHDCSVGGCDNNAEQCPRCGSWVCEDHKYDKGCYFCAECPDLPECDVTYCAECEEEYCVVHTSHECAPCPAGKHCVAWVCDSCRKTYCSAHDFEPIACNYCSNKVCVYCAATCDRCGAVYCRDCGHECEMACPFGPDCNVTNCKECGLLYCSVHDNIKTFTCSDCGKQPVCSQCATICEVCHGRICETCGSSHDCSDEFEECPDTPYCDIWTCEGCKAEFCAAHETGYSYCELCGAQVCGGCIISCDDCGVPMCRSCAQLCEPCNKYLHPDCFATHANDHATTLGD